MEKMPIVSNLDVIQSNHKVQMRFSLLENTRDLIRVHLRKVELLELTKGSTRGTAYNPSGLLFLNISQCLGSV